VSDWDRVEASGSPRAGVLWLHWFAPQEGGDNKTQFRSEAEGLAGQGVASALPQLTFPWSFDPQGSSADAQAIEAELSGFADAVEWLASQSDRLAIVGHDFGAMYALLLLARDPRWQSGVVIAPANRWADWFTRFWKIDEDRLDYMRALRRLDPIEHVASIAPRPLLMQFANDDYFIAGMDGAELFLAAGEPKRLERYDADHAMQVDAARTDRRGFLLETLGLTAPG
jgi:pimeloyl-ACP methyl ester carboxylesterase